MIQAISTGRQVSFSSSPAMQAVHSNVQKQSSSPYSKEYANASRSLALAAININKAQNISFKGEKMQELPEGWIFDSENISIKDNYGFEETLSASVKDYVSEQNKIGFDAFKKTIDKDMMIPFYRFSPMASGSKWMPDGYVALKTSGDLEYVCWKEISEQFDDD